MFWFIVKFINIHELAPVTLVSLYACKFNINVMPIAVAKEKRFGKLRFLGW